MSIIFSPIVVAEKRRGGRQCENFSRTVCERSVEMNRLERCYLRICGVSAIDPSSDWA